VCAEEGHDYSLEAIEPLISRSIAHTRRKNVTLFQGLMLFDVSPQGVALG
jgi:hypothetical protein